MTYNSRLISLCLLMLVGAALPGITGCSGGKPDRVYAEPADHIDQRLVDGNTGFGLNLFRTLVEKAPEENIFISPASVSLALAMTYNGAAGDTRQAMKEALRLQGMTRQDLNKAFADLNSILLNPDPKVELAIANSLWAREEVDFHEDFLHRNRDYFGARITVLNFNDSGAADTINAWVKEQTRGKIEDIVEQPIDPLTILFLINAIYFKGEWSEQFDPSLTRNIPFYSADGSSNEHPVMFQSKEYRYLKENGFQVVSLPYGKNERVSIYIFLPEPEVAIEDFYQQLTADNWQRWMNSFTVMEGDVGLPRFKFEYETSLKEVLEDLGMGVAFDPAAADFSGMRPTPPDLFISEVKHKTFIEVNEEGTEAAAATSVEVRVTSMPVKFNLIADRPFFFAIVDDKTATILFMGSVLDPR